MGGVLDDPVVERGVWASVAVAERPAALRDGVDERDFAVFLVCVDKFAVGGPGGVGADGNEAISILIDDSSVEVEYHGRGTAVVDRLISTGELPGVGYATDVGAGLVYRHAGAVVDVVADRPGAAAYRVERGDDGESSEVTLDVQHRLGPGFREDSVKITWKGRR